MKGHTSSSVSHLNIGSLYHSINWIIYSYRNLNSIEFFFSKKNVFHFGEMSSNNAELGLKKISFYCETQFKQQDSIFIIDKKEPFLVYEKTKIYYKIFYKEKTGYIIPFSLFSLREFLHRD